MNVIKTIPIPQVNPDNPNEYIGLRTQAVLIDRGRYYPRELEHYTIESLINASYKIFFNMNLADLVIVKKRFDDRFHGKRVAIILGIKVYLKCFRDAFALRLRHIKDAERYVAEQEKQSAAAYNKNKKVVANATRIEFRSWLAFEFLIICVNYLEDSKDNPLIHYFENDAARLLSAILYEIDKIFIGLETMQHFANRIRGWPDPGIKSSNEHFYPRQVAASLMIEMMRNTPQSQRTYEKCLPWLYQFIQIIRSTNIENVELKPEQKLDNAAGGPVAMYEKAGLLPLVRQREVILSSHWALLAEQYGVDLEIFSKFPEISTEEAREKLKIDTKE